MLTVRRVLKFPYRVVKYFKNKLKFGHISWHTGIQKPLKLECPENIYLEGNVSIHKYCWLASNPLTFFGGGKSNSKLIIRKGSSIGDFAHIYATKEIVIEENVLIANFVYISDNIHGYEDVSVPIKDQPIVQKKSVRIGADSWIGEHTCIIGASIGKHCVIGANAVVTNDIPDYSVAVGSPAKVIKQYNFETQQWEKRN